MKKKSFKVVSILLSIVVICGSLPIASFAVSSKKRFPIKNDICEKNEPKIEYEIVSERTLYSKVFATDDGGYYSVVNATPIHVVDENGMYQDALDVDKSVLTEETIASFISAEAEAINASEDSRRDTTPNRQVQTVPCIIKCFGVNTPYNGNQFLVQGTRTGNKSVFVLPTLTNSNIIVKSSKVSFDAIGTGTTANNFVYAVEATSQWDLATTNHPSVASSYFDDMIIIHSNSANHYEYDITNYVNSCLFGIKENYGFGFMTNKRNCNVSIQNVQIAYYYKSIDEIDPEFSYETIDMGFAGTAYINHFNCQPSIKINDLGIDGELAPVNIFHVFDNEDDSVVNPYGHGFRINYYSTLETKGANGYIWKSVDGETISFSFDSVENDEMIFVSQDSIDAYTLTLFRDDTTNEFENSVFENIIITKDNSSESFEFVSFSDRGYLSVISNGSNHQVGIDYDVISTEINNDTYENFIINGIIDGAGRYYQFDYGTVNGITSLSGITAYKTEAAAQTIQVGTGSGAVDYAVSFDYDDTTGTLCLVSISYVGSRSAILIYDSSNRIISLSNGSKKVAFTYANNSSNTLSSYKVSLIDGNNQEIVLDEIEMEISSVYQRIFTNQANEESVMNFNRNFDVVYLKDYDGSIVYGVVENDDVTHLIEKCNGTNLLNNPNFDTIINSEPANWECDEAYSIDILGSSDYAVGIGSSYNCSSYVYQTILPSNNENQFLENTRFIFGGSAYAEKAIPSASIAQDGLGDHTFGIQVFDARMGTGTPEPNECIAYLEFDETLQSWQERLSSFVLTSNTPALFVRLCFDFNYDEQSAYFDNIKLFKTMPDTAPLYNTVDTYNTNNSLISHKLESGVEGDSSFLEESYAYSNVTNLNYISSITGYDGVKTYYSFNKNNGRLESVALGYSNNKKYIEYTADGLLSTVRQAVTNTLTGNTVSLATAYSYVNDKITSVSHNGFSYDMTYDIYGNITSIAVNSANTPLKSISYSDAMAARVNTITYANGCTIEYQYDVNNAEKITQIRYKDASNNTIKSFAYTYDNEGNISSITDSKTNIKISYGTNSFEYILVNGSNETIVYSSQINNGLVSEVYNVDTDIHSTSTVPNSTMNSLTGEVITSSTQTITPDETSYSNTAAEYSYEKAVVTDEFGRAKSKSLLGLYELTATGENGTNSQTMINQFEGYDYNSAGNKKTTMPSSYTIINSTAQKDNNGNFITDLNNNIVYSDTVNVTFDYTYDYAGNITRIMATNNITNDSVIYASYKYDEAGQLILECSTLNDICMKFAYDAGGNIICKRVYVDGVDAFDPVTNDTVLNAEYYDITYTYDSVYKDRLYSINSIDYSGNSPVSTNISTFTYDAFNNPTSWNLGNDGAGSFEWTGNLLTAFETDGAGHRYEYEYDSNGLRSKKTVFEKTALGANSDDYNYSLQYAVEYVWENDVLKGLIIVTSDNYSASIPIIYDDNGVAQGYIGITGNPYYYTRDGIGNVVRIDSGVDATVSLGISYDAWGNPYFDTIPSGWENIGIGIAAAIIAMLNPSYYQGYLFDAETGLYYCQNRYYSSVISRFINTPDTFVDFDSRGSIISANLFVYGNNNPINYNYTSDSTASLKREKLSSMMPYMNISIYAVESNDLIKREFNKEFNKSYIIA